MIFADGLEAAHEMRTLARNLSFAIVALIGVTFHASAIPLLAKQLPQQPADFIPSDLAVQFSAEPTNGIESGQTIHFTLSVTNNGPEPVESVTLMSSDFIDEFYLDTATADCQAFLTRITDGNGFYYYNQVWYPAFFATLEVGETRTCHFTLDFSHQAPAVLPFSFGLANYETDLNPANNVQTVYLRRGSLPATLAATSPQALLLLGIGMLVCAGLALRPRRRQFPG